MTESTIHEVIPWFHRQLATVRADVAEPEENTLKPDSGGNWRPGQPTSDSQTEEGARGRQ